MPWIGWGISIIARKVIDRKLLSAKTDRPRLLEVKRKYLAASVARDLTAAALMISSIALGLLVNSGLSLIGICWYLGFACWNIHAIQSLKQEMGSEIRAHC